MQGVILYGPPASGKDTVTVELSRLDPRYKLFQRLKVGRGRTTGYRLATATELAILRANGEVIWETERYGATYVIDRPRLLAELADHTPVVHIGQSAAIGAITRAFDTTDWTVVELWCQRHIAEERLIARDPHDVARRLTVWDQTERLLHADLVVDTTATSPQVGAEMINRNFKFGSAAS